MILKALPTLAFKNSMAFWCPFWFRFYNLTGRWYVYTQFKLILQKCWAFGNREINKRRFDSKQAFHFPSFSPTQLVYLRGLRKKHLHYEVKKANKQTKPPAFTKHNLWAWAPWSRISALFLFICIFSICSNHILLLGSKRTTTVCCNVRVKKVN